MLKKVVLTNIQSYKGKNVIRFSPGLNVIIGESGTGKSALIRGIEWPIKNFPEGKKFKKELLTHGEETAKSELVFDNCTVKRTRGKNKNIYKLNDRILKAFGRNVPEDVKTAINISDINIQHHTEPFFLLLKSPSEVAKYLNSIADLEIIDRTTSNIRKEKNTTSTKVKQIKESLSEISKKLRKYKWIDKAIGLMNILEGEEKEINKIQNEIDKTSKMIEQLNFLKEKKDKYKFDPKIKKEIEILEKEENEDRVEKKELSTNIDIIESLKSKKKELKELKVKIEEHKTKFKALMPNICLLCGQRVKNKGIT